MLGNDFSGRLNTWFYWDLLSVCFRYFYVFMFIYKVKKSEDQRLQQQRDLDIKADALKCWTEDYVNNLPSQGNETVRERD